MRSVIRRPVLLVLTLALIAVAIFLIESRFGASDPGGSPRPVARAVEPEQAESPESPESPEIPDETTQNGREETTNAAEKAEATKETNPDEERISNKEQEYERAKEISSPSGFINTDGVTIQENLGEKVVLLDFWTYSCFNCQNTQPYLNDWQNEYADDGLVIIGVHKPEFEFEKDYAGVAEAVRQAGIEYPVVLDNDDATWDAYDQHYWPTMYLIDADGFVRYKHIGEGAYDETEAKIRDLLAERDRIRS